MAYSDYGGYGYKNSVRVEERSDAVINPNIETIPGTYPGFAAAIQGMSRDKFNEIRGGSPNGHVVIGDDPIYVGLYKQSTVMLWFKGTSLSLLDYADNLDPKFISEYDGEKYIDTITLSEENDMIIHFKLPDGYDLEVKWTSEPNYYVFARLATPDGDVWHGWSGYGVGAGLENAGYGYDTNNVVDMMVKIWPADFRDTTGEDNGNVI